MKKLIIFAVVSVLIICAAISIPYVLIFNTNKWIYAAEYDEYADEFNLIKDYVLEEYPNETDKWLSVTSGSEPNRLFDPDSDLDSPDEINEALTLVCRNAFPHKDSYLEVIRIHGNRVSFCIPNGQYALVYSPDEKPSWVNSPTETNGVFVKKIGDGWYHVSMNPN